MARTSQRWRLGLLGVVASALVAWPASAFGKPVPPKPATAEEAAWTYLADRAAACLGREDPLCVEALLPEFAKVAPPGAVSVDYLRGVAHFLAGRFADAQAILTLVAGHTTASRDLREKAESWIELAEATAGVLQPAKAHRLAGGRVVAWIRPGPDEVLIAYLDAVLAKTLPRLEAAFGPATAPLTLHVYPRADDLARVSGLTIQQIRTSGTIALCKHNRLMLTSPQDLVFGYAWADTVAHEMVHWFVIKRGGPQVPVWLHEGLARSLQGVWRGAAPEDLDKDEREIAAWARKHKKFVPLERMYPSMALLPSQQETQLAFAEVHHAVTWTLQRAAQRQGRTVEQAQGAGEWVALFGQGLDENATLVRMLGVGMAGFQQAWRKDWQKLELRDAPEGANRRPLLVFRNVPGVDELRPATPQARRFAELGDRFAVLKRPLAAAIEYRKALAAGPQEGPLLVARLVRVLLDLGKVVEALEYLQPAREAFPDHAPLQVLAGRAAVLRSQWKDALESLEKAAWLNPYDPQVHALAAQAHAALGQEGEAAAARGRLALVESAGL